MTTEARQSMKSFEAKVRQVIAQYRVLKQENADLYTELESKEEEIKKLKAELTQSKNDYNNLKLAKMIEISDADIKESKMKITQMVREINKCISMLSSATEEDTGGNNWQAHPLPARKKEEACFQTDNSASIMAKLNIKVTIEDIPLPLQVSTPEEEKIYRDAASSIQRRIQRLRDAYPHLPNDKYYYAMAMLNTSVEAVKAANRLDTQPYVEMIQDIEKEIETLGIK